VTVSHEWRGEFLNAELEALHAEGFGHEPIDFDWRVRLDKHSLGWVCARDGGDLAGFVNVIWDGGVHAFILDTVVAAAAQRAGIGTELVAVAAGHAREAGCEWLHVDFEDHLAGFYFQACGFRPTQAGLIRLRLELCCRTSTAVPGVPDLGSRRVRTRDRCCCSSPGRQRSNGRPPSGASGRPARCLLCPRMPDARGLVVGQVPGRRHTWPGKSGSLAHLTRMRRGS
jgi:GNAT superfamily N-acetyltransferase